MKHAEQITFSNPRTYAEIEDWPIGRQRCRARFTVESKIGHGERVSRVTENKTRTGWNKPKCTTYATRFVIVDGSDGRIYLVALSRPWACINIWPGTLKGSEYVPLNSSPERYAELLPLFDVGQAEACPLGRHTRPCGCIAQEDLEADERGEA